MSAGWWESGPVFSVTDRGSKITTVAPDGAPGAFTAALGSGAVLTALVWTGLMFIGIPRLMGGGYTHPDIETAAHRWWWIALLVAGVLAMMTATPGLYGEAKKRFGQDSVAFGLAATAACLGTLVAGVIHLSLLSDYLGSPPEGLESWELPDGSILLIFTLVAILGAAMGLVWLPYAVSRARRRQRQVLRLRANGIRHVGTLVRVHFKNHWISGRPQFDVEVRYDREHSSRTIRAAMSTTSERVPLDGARVVVFDDGAGEVLVEPDPDEQLSYDSNVDRYIQPSGGGS